MSMKSVVGIEHHRKDLMFGDRSARTTNNFADQFEMDSPTMPFLLTLSSVIVRSTSSTCSTGSSMAHYKDRPMGLRPTYYMCRWRA